MTPTERIPEPLVLVIFGASGDLTKRKLLPALYSLAREGLLPARFAVVGFARKAMTSQAFRDAMREGCDKFARRRPVDNPLWDAFSANLHYHQGDYADPASFTALKERLEGLDRELHTAGNRLFYLSTPPSTYEPIIANLGKAGLAKRNLQPLPHIIIEKPFGHDLDSARHLNGQLKKVFRESQIFRIDHYLGKETVQNMLVLRFGNGIFEPLWNNRHVDHVQITAMEAIGVEGRGGYYEEAGILRDMVQNHLFQLLSLTGMEPPSSMESNAVRDEKVKFLRSLRPIPQEDVSRFVVRGQYAPGTLGGEKVPGYRQEDGVAADSVTDTYTALKLYADNWRWAGVPFLLRTAKRGAKRITEISVHFKPAPLRMFGGHDGLAEPNQLVIQVQPDEGISLHFSAKEPGPTTELLPVDMTFRYGASFGKESPEAYERLILDAMLGDSTLFTRDDEVEASWAFITNILTAWKKQKARQIAQYTAGSWGPQEADALLEPGMTWRKP